jgi:hypothetical protein
MSHRERLIENASRLIALAVACWIVPAAAWAQSGESVVYSVTTGDTRSGIAADKTQFSKTEIFAVDPETGKPRLVFSDADSALVLMPGGGQRRGASGAAGGRIFAEGASLGQTTAHGVYLYLGAPAIYELSTDGSGQARKVLDLGSNRPSADFSDLFFNSSGTELGNINHPDNDNWYVVIHDTASGKQLQKSKLVVGGLAVPARIGWMRDDKRIFFGVIEGGDDPEASWTTPNSPVGTYVLDAGAGTTERLAPEASLHPRIAGMDPSGDFPATFIGPLPDGGYLLWDYQRGPSGDSGACVYLPSKEAHACLYELDFAQKTQRIFPLPGDGDPWDFHLSPSGNLLAFTTTRVEYQQQPRFTSTSTLSAWVLDLRSGKEWKVISFPPEVDGRGPKVNLIGWLARK